MSLMRDIASLQGKGIRGLMCLLLCYVGALWWTHHLVRTPLNLAYFKQYVVARCGAALTDQAERPRSRETLVEIDRGLRRCQALGVEIDGVWGGIFGEPSVRLKVTSDGGATEELAYYSVAVSPMLGLASIRYELDPSLYYLNL